MTWLAHSTRELPQVPIACLGDAQAAGHSRPTDCVAVRKPRDSAAKHLDSAPKRPLSPSVSTKVKRGEMPNSIDLYQRLCLWVGKSPSAF